MVHPEISIILCRDFSPRMKVTCRSGILNCVAMNCNSAALARPSIGGTASFIFSALPCKPTTSFNFAPGWMYKLKIKLPFLC